MKQVIAIVKPHLAEQVLEVLKRSPIEALQLREVKGYGRQKNRLAEYEENEFASIYLPKIEISFWCDASRCEEIASRVEEAARTGRQGDGKIFILPDGEFREAAHEA